MAFTKTHQQIKQKALDNFKALSHPSKKVALTNSEDINNFTPKQGLSKPQKKLRKIYKRIYLSCL